MRDNQKYYVMRQRMEGLTLLGPEYFAWMNVREDCTTWVREAERGMVLNRAAAFKVKAIVRKLKPEPWIYSLLRL